MSLSAHKKLGIYFLLLLQFAVIVSLAVYLGLNHKQTNLDINSDIKGLDTSILEVNEAQTTEQMNVLSLTYSDHSSNCQGDLSVPQLINSRNIASEKGFNDYMEKGILLKYIKRVTDTDTEEGGTRKLSYTQKSTNEKYVSLSFEYDFDCPNFAHPDSEIFTLNYDLKRNKIISFADIFVDNEQTIAFLYSSSREKLNKQLDEESLDEVLYKNKETKLEFILSNIPEERDSFSNFFVKENEITFILPSSRLNPDTQDRKITFTINELNDYLKPGNILLN